MSWYKTGDDLSSQQKQILDEIVNSYDKYFYIRGFVGTGKSILLLNILKNLVYRYAKINICFLTYNEILVELAKTVPFYDDIKLKAPFMTYRDFLKVNKKTYKYIVVDEIQEIPIEDLIKLKNSAHRVVCSGDFNQQIYLHRATETELIKVMDPTILELTDIFRLTKAQCELAVSVAPRTKLTKGLKAAVNPESSIELARAANEADECRWVYREAASRARPGRPSAVLLPTYRLANQLCGEVAGLMGLHDQPMPVKRRGRCDYEGLNAFWRGRRVNLRFVDNASPSLREADGEPFVFLLTYHNAKGLAFDNVLIPFLSEETTIIRDNADLESRLLFSACARSSRNLVLTYSGERAHRLLGRIALDRIRTVRIPGPAADPA